MGDTRGGRHPRYSARCRLPWALPPSTSRTWQRTDMTWPAGMRLAPRSPHAVGTHCPPAGRDSALTRTRASEVFESAVAADPQQARTVLRCACLSESGGVAGSEARHARERRGVCACGEAPRGIMRREDRGVPRALSGETPLDPCVQQQRRRVRARRNGAFQYRSSAHAACAYGVRTRRATESFRPLSELARAASRCV